MTLTERRSRLKEAFRSRTPLFAAWTSFGHPQITEIFAAAGVDFIGIDIEHSTISLEQSLGIIAAAQAGGSLCLPRIASHNPEMIKRLLDSGADGVIVPMVSTPQEVENLIAWTKYPPQGRRSFGVARAQEYGFSFESYAKTWNGVSSLILQIESVEGVENIEELLAYDEVDGVMVGPYDLSGSLGIPGQIDSPQVAEAAARVVKTAARMGKACGTQIVEPTPDALRNAIDQGFTFSVLASDVFILWKWAERVREHIRDIQASA